MISLSDLNLSTMTPNEIGELLITAKKAYYTTSKPIMDDHTFDTLEEILKQKAPHHRIFSKVGNPNFDTGFAKKTHVIHMGSQNKVNTYEDLIHYFKLKKIDSNTQFVVQPKCDGISLEIEYKNGKLVDAITRGDGETGDIVTQNVVNMQNFSTSIPSDFTGSIRCEIVVTANDFQKLNKITNNRPVKGGGSTTVETEGLNYSNPRNAASGITQRLDSQYSNYCSLFAVDITSLPIKGGGSNLLEPEGLFFESDKISLIKSLGFTPVDSWICNTLEEIEKIYQSFLTEKRQNYEYEIDGLVIKINDLNIQKELGIKNKRPKGQVAYKFPSLSTQTRIINIQWQVGPMGAITPVAQVDPIEISGAIIRFASLANHDLIKKKNININDIVEISRRGDVIPCIESVITKVTSGHIDIPKFCPSCNSKLIIENKFLKCSNSINCPSQILGGLKLFCDILDIKGISEKTIEKLYQDNKLKLPGDFYNLSIDNFINLEGLGEKSGNNIINQIQSKKSLTLLQVLDASAIPSFSTARIKQIINFGFNTPEKILNLSISDIEPLPGLQITLATKIIEGLLSKKHIIKSIINNINLINTEKRTNTKLLNQTFCITGPLSKKREDVIKDIEDNGGKIVNSVSKKLSYLITNETESDSSKYITAKSNNIPIITEKELYNLF